MPLTLLFNKDESCVYFPIFVISNSPIGHGIHISKFILNYILQQTYEKIYYIPKVSSDDSRTLRKDIM